MYPFAGFRNCVLNRVSLVNVLIVFTYVSAIKIAYFSYIINHLVKLWFVLAGLQLILDAIHAVKIGEF